MKIEALGEINADKRWMSGDFPPLPDARERIARLSRPLWILPYLLHLSSDEEVQLPTETQHLQPHLLRTQLHRRQWPPHL